MINKIRIGKKIHDLSTPVILGIINSTPDSFYDKSRTKSLDDAIHKIDNMVSEGVDWIDIGGYSTRPNASEISIKEECERIIPVIIETHRNYPNLIISCDTFRGKVAEKALHHGASIINDVSGGSIDSTLLDVVSEYQCPYVLMHSRGNPQTMQKLTTYSNIFKDVAYYFSHMTKKLHVKGINDVILDIGFGFAKTTDQNHLLFSKLQDFAFLNKPLLVGVSRKSMIYKQLNCLPEDSLNGTTVLHTLALNAGAQILRVHDVKEAKEAIQLIQASTFQINPEKN